jgi:hypothetical protein
MDEEILLADGFEDAFIGIGVQFNKRFTIYDRKLCIKILMKRDKMTHEEAEEFFQFNVEGSYVGESTPCFIEKCTIEDLNELYN